MLLLPEVNQKNAGFSCNNQQLHHFHEHAEIHTSGTDTRVTFQTYYGSNTQIWTCTSAEGLKDKHL